MAENELKLTISAVDEATRTIENVKKSVADFGAEQERLARLTKVVADSQKKYSEAIKGEVKQHELATDAAKKFQESFPTPESYQAAVAEGERLNESIRTFSEQSRNAGISAESLKNALRDMASDAAKAALGFLAIRKVVQEVIGFFKDSVSEASESEQAFNHLARAAQAFGYSADEAVQKAWDLSENGLVNVRTNADLLAQLLRTGLGIDEASSLIERFSDVAASGGPATKNLEEKLDSLTTAFITNRTQTAKANGLLIDFSTAERIGAEAIGKKVNQLTEAERIQARYLGILEATNDVVGAASDYANTYEGSMLVLSNTINDLQRSIGAAMIPTLRQFASDLAGTANNANLATETSAGLAGSFMAIYQGTKIAIKSIVLLGDTMWELVKGPFQWAIQGVESVGAALGSLYRNIRSGSFENIGIEMKAIWGDFTQGMGGWWSGFKSDVDAGLLNIISDIQNFFPNIYKAAEQAMGVFGLGVRRIAEEADTAYLETVRNAQAMADKIAKIIERIREENERYQESLEKTKRQFEESLSDMVISHREKREQLEQDITEETRSFEEASEERRKAYREELADMEERHKEWMEDYRERVDELRQDAKDRKEEATKDYEEETKELKEKNKEQVEDYKVRVEELEKDAEEKKQEIIKKQEEETKQIEENLLRQLSASHDRDETLIFSAKKRLDELKRQYDEETRKVDEELRNRLDKEQKKFDDEVQTHKNALAKKKANYDEETAKINKELNERLAKEKKKLDDEVAANQKALEKKKKQYEEETAKAKKEYEKRLADLNKSLDEEKSVWEKYKDDFERLRDTQMEDDITRLKRHNSEELEEMRRHHEQVLAELEREKSQAQSVQEGAKVAEVVTQPGPTAGDWRTYTVKAGDTLWDIAQRFLGAGTRWGELQGYSGDPRKMPIGTVLRIPPAQEGMIVPGIGPMPIMAHGGETILTRKQTTGLLKALEKLAEGQGASGGEINIEQVVLRDDYDVDAFLNRLEFKRRMMA